MERKIEVNMSELSKTADRLETDLQNFVSYVNQLYTDNLMQIRNGWRSKDNMVYLDKFTDYLEDLKQLGDSVSDYIAFLRLAQQSYDTVLSECASQVKGG